MSSSASLTSGCSPRSSNVGALGSVETSLVAVVSLVIAGGMKPAWASATPFALGAPVGVVPSVIWQYLPREISEVLQSEHWSGRGAEIHRDQATSLAAARRGASETELVQHILVLARPVLRRTFVHTKT